MVIPLLRWLGPRASVRVGLVFVLLGLGVVGLSLAVGAGAWIQGAWIHGVVLTVFGVLFVVTGARRGRGEVRADAVEHVAVR